MKGEKPNKDEHTSYIARRFCLNLPRNSVTYGPTDLDTNGWAQDLREKENE